LEISRSKLSSLNQDDVAVLEREEDDGNGPLHEATSGAVIDLPDVVSPSWPRSP